jgi:hypothetical protein
MKVLNFFLLKKFGKVSKEENNLLVTWWLILIQSPSLSFKIKSKDSN